MKRFNYEEDDFKDDDFPNINDEDELVFCFHEPQALFRADRAVPQCGSGPTPGRIVRSFQSLQKYPT